MLLYCRVILIHLFIVLSTLLGASLLPTGQVGGGDHNTMNVGGGGSGLALPVPLHLAPVTDPQPMQMSIQPVQTLPMAPMHELCPQMYETFASQHMHLAYNYNPNSMLSQDFAFATTAAHQQMPMSPISPDETRV